MERMATLHMIVVSRRLQETAHGCTWLNWDSQEGDCNRLHRHGSDTPRTVLQVTSEPSSFVTAKPPELGCICSMLLPLRPGIIMIHWPHDPCEDSTMFESWFMYATCSLVIISFSACVIVLPRPLCALQGAKSPQRPTS